MNKALKTALVLGFITVGYNIIEGIVSVAFGASDDTLALFGFGLDSFVEVISGIGIVHLILRMKYAKVNSRDKFERTALRVSGFSFYLLTVSLVFGSVYNLYYKITPSTTIAGVIIAAISIVTMYALMNAKLKIGKELNSDAIIADANCTKTCFYLSFILLAASGLYELFKINYIDIIGSLAIAYYAFKEGKEAFEKSRSEVLSCGCEH